MIYEYRVYHAESGRMNDLHNRFATRTNDIFAKNNIKVIGYWVPEGREEEDLVYLLAFDSKDQMKQAWNDFVEDPNWKATVAETEANGPLVASIESTIYYATSYSPLQ